MMNNRLKAIVHTPFNPFFKGNGAHVRARQFIDFFATEFDTTVIYTNADSEVLFDKKKLTGLAKANNFEIYPLNTSFKFSKLKGISTSTDIYPFDVSEEIAKVCMQINPDICLVNYVFLTHTFSFCDQDCKTIIDTHDKLSRKHVFEEAGLDVSFFCCTEEHEQELCKTADSIISITNTEAEYFSSISDDILVFTIGHTAFPSSRAALKGAISADGKLQIGLVGSGHVFNRLSADAFFKEFQSKPKSFEINIAGSLSKVVDIGLSEANKLGYIDSIDTFYQENDLIVAPVDFGTGLKIKTAECLMNGFPIIGTSTAFDGLPTLSGEGIFKNSKAMAHFLFSLTSNELRSYIQNIENITLSRAIVYKSTFEKERKSLLSFLKSSLTNSFKADQDISKCYNIYHIVNITSAPPTSDLYVAQLMMMKSMIRARNFALISNTSLTINLIARVFKDELPQLLDMPHGELLKEFEIDENLVGTETLPGSPKSRNLPLLKSLLAKPESADLDDLCIYTNSDICLKEAFYISTFSSFNNGNCDARIINRRTIDKIYSLIDSESQLSNYCVGSNHPGFDCFAFKFSSAKKFVYSDTSIGVHLIGRVLLWNLLSFCENLSIDYTSTLTYHYGDDNSSKKEDNSWYTNNNMRSAVETLKQLPSGLEEKVKENNLNKNLLQILYKPNQFLDPNYKSLVCIHGLFRVGSTYIFDSIRKHNKPNIEAFYEPFHEYLASITQSEFETISHPGEMHKNIKLNSSIWDSYFPILNQSGKGVEGFSVDLSYQDMTCRKPHINAEKKRYIDSLYRLAITNNKQCMLQPNRTWLMGDSEINSIFSSCVLTQHIYIKRDLFDTYMSMKVHSDKVKNPGFFRSLAVIIFYNWGDKIDILSETSQKMIQELSSSINESCSYNKVMLSIEQYITKNSVSKIDIFLDSIKLHCETFAFHRCLLLDINLLSTSIIYAREIEAAMARNFTYVDFSDANVATYSKDTSEYEKFSNLGGDKICDLLHSKYNQMLKLESYEGRELGDHSMGSMMKVVCNSTEPTKVKVNSLPLLFLPNSSKVLPSNIAIKAIKQSPFLHLVP